MALDILGPVGMIAFWSVSALLVAGALLFLLPPLLRRPATSPGNPRDAINLSLYRDQFAELENDLRNGGITTEQFERSRRELQRRLLEEVPAAAAHQAAPRHKRSGHARRRDPRHQQAAHQGAPKHARSGRIAAAIVGLGVPLAAVMLYLQLGNLDGLSARKAAPAQAVSAAEPSGTDVASLTAHLELNPLDVPAWTRLARAYTASARYAEAVGVYSKLAALRPDSAQVWAEYAVALAMASGGRLQGQPLELVDRALQRDPDNRQALLLAGRAQLEAGNPAGAVTHWEHLLRLLPADSESARKVAANLDRVRSLAGTSTPAAAVPASGAAMGAPHISGVISLDKTLEPRNSPGDTVFLYAHVPGAGNMPVAAMRLQVRDLPAAFALDDSKTITPDRKLSDFPEVSVVARISKSGDARPHSGDLQGTIPRVMLGSSVKIVIDTVIP